MVLKWIIQLKSSAYCLCRRLTRTNGAQLRNEIKFSTIFKPLMHTLTFIPIQTHYFPSPLLICSSHRRRRRSRSAYTNFKSYFKCFSHSSSHSCQIIVFASYRRRASTRAPRTSFHYRSTHINHICLNDKLAKFWNWNHSAPLFRLREVRGRETQSAINNEARGNNNKMPFEFNLFIIHWQVFVHASE